MKKSALAMAAAMAVTSGLVMIPGAATHAATIFEGADTRVDLHGRLRMALINTDGDNDFRNLSSRFGFRFNHTVNPDLAVFANTEFRFEPTQQNNQSMTIRNTFFGLNFTDVGRVTAGNFDSIYYQQVSALTNIQENDGDGNYRALNTGGQRARGNTISFDSASFGGFRFGVSAKLQREETDIVDGEEEVVLEEEISTMAYIGYTWEDLNIAVAYDQANEDFADGNEDSLFGFRVDYNVLPTLNIGAMVELQGDRTHYSGVARYNYGMGHLYGIISYLDDDTDDIDEQTTQYLVGASYRFSQPMYAFTELSTGNAFESDDRPRITLGARYNF